MSSENETENNWEEFVFYGAAACTILSTIALTFAIMSIKEATR